MAVTELHTITELGTITQIVIRTEAVAEPEVDPDTGEEVHPRSVGDKVEVYPVTVTTQPHPSRFDIPLPS
jgi:hypothetical protein